MDIVSKYTALLGQQKLKESFVKDLELVLSRKNPNIEKGKLNFIRYSEMKNWSVRELFGEDLEQADRALTNKVYHMLFDIDGRGNTERLVTRNPKLRNLLEDGEYIPSLGQLNLMAHYMDELNKAFAYVSASPLSSTWYRSSTESSPSVAWYVDFSIGSAYYSDKYNSSRVRAVIDF